jgi:3-oxoacyl-[acyl-carrier protein] reductase
MSLMTWTRTAADYSALVDTGLAGKVVLVTGGAGGIGSACVRAFAAEGARVAVHYRTSRERAEALASEIGGVAIGADLTDEAAVEQLFTRAREDLGDVEICAAVAGVWPRDDEPVWRLGLERWEEVLRANLTATFLTARGFLREVERIGRGNLVLVGSTAGRFGEAGHSDYAAAKSAIQVGLLLSLKNEIVRIAPHGRVNAIAPGWTVSPMTRGALDDSLVAGITRTMALRKVAVADDIARAVVVLASDELSGHITGELVTVAGGMEGRTVHSGEGLAR